MPETVLLRALKEVKDDLDKATTKFDEASTRLEGQVSILHRLRIYFWVAVVVVIVFAIGFVLLYRQGQDRVDQIQDSRLASCIATEKAKAALIERDAELVNIAVEVAEGDPEISRQIIDRLDSGPSAAALVPLNCEDVIAGD